MSWQLNGCPGHIKINHIAPDDVIKIDVRPRAQDPMLAYCGCFKPDKLTDEELMSLPTFDGHTVLHGKVKLITCEDCAKRIRKTIKRGRTT